jgi:hypothetical protein
MLWVEAVSRGALPTAIASPMTRRTLTIQATQAARAAFIVEAP